MFGSGFGPEHPEAIERAPTLERVEQLTSSRGVLDLGTDQPQDLSALPRQPHLVAERREPSPVGEGQHSDGGTDVTGELFHEATGRIGRPFGAVFNPGRPSHPSPDQDVLVVGGSVGPSDEVVGVPPTSKSRDHDARVLAPGHIHVPS